MTPQVQSRLIKFGIYGTIQFLILIHVAMYLYKGGSLHQPHLEGYSFTTNFFSDLGRNRLFTGAANFPTSIIFRTTMAFTGVSVALFFLAVPSLFRQPIPKALAVLAAFFGIIAGLSYVAIGNVPYDVSYWRHTWFVRVGFINFLLMVLLYSMAIFSEKNYPNRYGWVFIIFGGILTIQIAIMLLGPRSWRSPQALFLQAVAQKIVVYAEVVCMLIQAIGALTVIKKRFR